jgi:hypothetical protein
VSARRKLVESEAALADMVETCSSFVGFSKTSNGARRNRHEFARSDQESRSQAGRVANKVDVNHHFRSETMNGFSTRVVDSPLQPSAHVPMARLASVGYWICTALTVFFIVPGGLAYALAVPDVVDGVVQLGFPLYFIQLLGVWKVLGGLAILAPGFPRLKEWAYAGIIFELTGAALANATMGASIGAEWWHVPAPLVIAAIAVISWALRPLSRRLPGPAL